jgi:hypothetical protein
VAGLHSFGSLRKFSATKKREGKAATCAIFPSFALAKTRRKLLLTAEIF